MDEYLIKYTVLTFTFKPILDTILNYFINRFKDRKNNLLLFYSITFGLYIFLLQMTEFNFLPRIKKHIDITEYFALGFSLFLILDLIVTAIYFKKNKKIFITLLSVAFFLFISYIIYTCMGHCSKICEMFLDVNDYIIDVTSIILFIIKAIFSAIYTVYLIYKSIIKLKNYKTNQSK